MGLLSGIATSVRFWKIYFGLLLFGIVLLLFMSWGLLGYMPDMEDLQNPNNYLSTEVYSSDSVLLGKYYIQNRSNVPYEKLPTNLVNALMATEDIRFREHAGVDLRAIFRAVFGVVSGDSKGGGSTITQQTAKNLFPRESVNKLTIVFRKLKEWIIAAKLERTFSKNEIIALYFNTVEFSDNAFGIESAAHTYFNKPVDSLKIEECAVLVGMLKAPYKYNPRINPENAKQRRNVVLDQMYNYNFITKEQRDSLFQLPIKLDFNVQSHTDGLAPYFREYLRLWLKDWCKTVKKANGEHYDIYKDGLRVYTTINAKMQEMAEQAQKEHLTEWQKVFNSTWKNGNPWKDFSKEWNAIYTHSQRYLEYKKQGLTKDQIDAEMHKPIQMKIFTWKGEKDTLMSPFDSIYYYRMFLQNGFLALDAETGFVRAWVGGINYKYFQYDHVNINTKRQAGSTFKPFVYAAAMRDKGYEPCFSVPNSPVTFQAGDPRFKLISNWTPKNSDGRYGGSLTLREALAKSVNTVSAYLMKEMSPMEVIKIAQEMGVKSNIPEQPSICLGAADISLIEMVGAYTTFINKGVYIEPTFVSRIEDRSGISIVNFAPKVKEVMDEKTAYNMIDLMSGVATIGTGKRLSSKYNLSMPIIGKTGTTQNNSDGWFIGATPDLLAGSWTGCEDRFIRFRSTAYGQGAASALPVWALFMKKVYADSTAFHGEISPSKKFTEPENYDKNSPCHQYQPVDNSHIGDYTDEGEFNEDSLQKILEEF